MAKNIALEIGRIAQSTVTLDLERHMRLNDVSVLEFENWGKRIIEELRKNGIYVNVSKGDPSGRW